MSNDNTLRSTNRKLRAIIAVDIQNKNRAIDDGLQLLCDRAATILETIAPAK